MRLTVLFLLALSLRAAQVQRIVSTAPSITETLFAMGLGPRVVGVTVYCSFPAEVLKLPKIGRFLKPDIEAIVALHPDLVVVQRQPNHLSEELASLHIRYVEVASENLEAVYAGAREIGKATDTQKNAEQLIQSMRRQLKTYQNLSSKAPKTPVAFIVGHDAGSLQGLIAGGGGSYFSDLLAYAGAANVFADAATAYPKISLEEIILRNPDVIIELSGDNPQKQSQVLSLWQSWPTLKAVRTKRVYAIESGPFVVPGPRVTDAVKILLRLLHPEIHS